MCDTLVAMGNATADGSVIFAKNSDREVNEAHHLILVPAADHPTGSEVQCTYVAIPQAAHTHAVLLAKPFWIWGAEMGANEHGVVIGNEALFTRLPYDKKPGLIGMDFLRLALERGATAAEALKVITTLLEEHGQGGNCGFTHAFYYHNSFLIADPGEAWVLETAGREWAAEKVKDIRTISNAITIGSEWDLASQGLVETAVRHGWCKGRADFDFARCYSDPLYTRFADARKRQCATTDALRASGGKVDVHVAMTLLRAHVPNTPAGVYTPNQGLTGADVCMHASFGPVRNSQTVGSMVSHLDGNQPTHWLTGTAAPCTSTFKPVWMDAGLPDMGPQPDGRYNRETLFWRNEILHRETLRDYRERLPLYQNDRDVLEGEFLQGAEACQEKDAAGRLDFSASCFERAEAARRQWVERIRDTKVVHHLSVPYAMAWKDFNRKAGLA